MRNSAEIDHPSPERIKVVEYTHRLVEKLILRGGTIMPDKSYDASIVTFARRNR
jgi:hypothetical protein